MDFKKVWVVWVVLLSFLWISPMIRPALAQGNIPSGEIYHPLSDYPQPRTVYRQYDPYQVGNLPYNAERRRLNQSLLDYQQAVSGASFEGPQQLPIPPLTAPQYLPIPPLTNPQVPVIP